MRVVVRSRGKPVSDELQLLVPQTSRWDDLSSNVVALLSAGTGHSSPKFYPPEHLGDRRGSMTASGFCHVAVALLLLNVTKIVLFTGDPQKMDRAHFDKQRIEWYRMADRLPAISPGQEEAKPAQEKGGKRPEPARPGATALHPQRVVANAPNPDNAEQTIFQPDAPNLRITQSQPLPNIVMWNEVSKPAPPVDLVSRQMSALKMPTDLVAVPRVEAPKPEPKPEIPKPDLPLAPDPIVAPPDVSALGTSADMEARVRKIVVMNANPAPPGGPLDVPAGNRAGAFSAGPNGRSGGTPNGTGTSEAAGAGGPAPAGDGSMGGKRDLAGIRVPGLAVLGGANPGGPVVSGPPPSPAPAVPRVPLPSAPSPSREPADARALLMRPARPQLPSFNAPKDEPGFTPGKRIYTVFINMPNLASGGGGSWVLRFAELITRLPGDQIDITAPTAIRKIDPGYAADAVRERIEGKVLLHAIIRRDGRVEHVEILKKLDDRLDQRAVDAFLRWEFMPALRQGVPVDLEAVVEIPFTLAKVF